MQPDVSLKIAMIGSRGFSVNHSGLETHVRELARSLAKMGQHLTVYGRRNHRPASSCDNEIPGSLVTSIDGFCMHGKFTATISNSIWATLHAIRLRRFDILHFHGIGCIGGMLLARAFHIPTVLSLHSTNWQENKWNRLSQRCMHSIERLCVSAADATIAVSDSLADRIASEYGVCAEVIPNSVSINGSPENDANILRSLDLQPNEFVLYVGRIVPDKGCHVIMEAFAQSGIPLKLALAGPHTDPKYLDRLELMAQRCDSEVRILGHLDADVLGALYRNCRLFCSASISEGQPIVLMEALAHGADCLVSDIPGHRELITDPGALFPVGDIFCLREKLVSICTQERDEQHAAWLYNHLQYNPEAVARRTLEAYLKVLQRRSHGKSVEQS